MRLAKAQTVSYSVLISGAESLPELHLSAFGRLLFWATAIYVVAPLENAPLLGLSPSAFFIALVALEVFLGKHSLRLGQFKQWSINIYFLWLGYLLSIAGNALLGNISAGFGDYLWLIRAAFWFLAFITITIVVARMPTKDLRTLVMLIGLAVIFLGGVRIYEGIAYGSWGAGGSVRILTQNTYGISFSRFSLFAVALYFTLSGIWRQLSLAGLLILLVAIAVNGSRSSWIAVSAGLVAFTVLYSLARPRQTGRLLWFISLLLVIFTLAISFLPIEVLEPISTRFATLEKIEEDKSFATRQLMVQKSQRLFMDSPLFGAGLGRFRVARVDLERPDLLRGSSTDFNRVASHNSYARLLGETGLAGTVPFAFLILTLLFGGFRPILRYARQGEVWTLAAYASFIAMSIHMWSIDNLNNTAPWFVYGLVAGIIERNKVFSIKPLT